MELSLDEARREGEGEGEEVSEALGVREMVWKNIGRGVGDVCLRALSTVGKLNI